MRVRFIAQAWVNDYALEIDPSGPTEWETHHLPAALDGYTDKTDALEYERWFLDDPDCPEWIKDHHGPFRIEVAD